MAAHRRKTFSSEKLQLTIYRISSVCAQVKREGRIGAFPSVKS